MVFKGQPAVEFVRGSMYKSIMVCMEVVCGLVCQPAVGFVRGSVCKSII